MENLTTRIKNLLSFDNHYDPNVPPEIILFCDYCEKPIKNKKLNYDSISKKIYHLGECSALSLAEDTKKKMILKTNIKQIPRDLAMILLNKGDLHQSIKSKG